LCVLLMFKLAWPRWKEAAVQKILQVPEAVVTVVCTPDVQASLATLEGGSCTTNMTSTGDCSYDFVYS